MRAFFKVVGTDPAYAKALLGLAKRLDFPDVYLDRIGGVVKPDDCG